MSDSKPSYIMAIDQGTTSSRAILFDANAEFKAICKHQIDFEQHFPQDGWVEHNPDDICNTVETCCKKVIASSKVNAKEIAGIGISNQRETTLIWDKKTGECIYPAIVWQDRRTADQCEKWNQDKELLHTVQTRTGLLLDPYFSASKIAWILDNVAGARKRAEQGELCFGTVDTFLLWKLTGGQVHATDASNASRTLLLNIKTSEWDDELLQHFNIPREILPTVHDNSYEFGHTDEKLFGAKIPITGMAGDQQAAAFGQTCFKPGMVKSTYGTGCFLMMNTGKEIMQSKNKLLSTIAYQLNGERIYALEGSIFIAGAAVQWLRDALNIINDAADTTACAQSIEDTGGVYLVPAFTGLGAPYWDPKARGALVGLSRDSGIKHIVRAALEAVCYQTVDLLHAMQKDGVGEIENIRVDGGMAANNWLCQFLSDILDCPVERPHTVETSALGAAFLSALGAGLFKNLDEISKQWKSDQVFKPEMPEQKRKNLYKGWQAAVKMVLSRD